LIDLVAPRSISNLVGLLCSAITWVKRMIVFRPAYDCCGSLSNNAISHASILLKGTIPHLAIPQIVAAAPSAALPHAYTQSVTTDQVNAQGEMTTERFIHFFGDTTMKFIKITLAAALFGLSVNAFAAASDLSNVTHGSKDGQQQPQTGQISQPSWSDRNAINPQSDVKPFAKSAGNYSFGDISSVTHN
jgi:hypothetical protein